MQSFSQLIRFEAEDGKIYFSDLGGDAQVAPSVGTSLKAFKSLDVFEGKAQDQVKIRRLLAPIPNDRIPIYCVGLNYKSHAKEASLSIPKFPPLWTKPAASLAHPDEDIPLNKFCSTNLPDYEGELVFVTRDECRDLSEAEAEKNILGYTIGNDLSCRMFQLPDKAGGQFFFAKAFDKFAPIGPILLSPKLFGKGEKFKMIAKVNGEVRQTADFANDLVFSPAQILSHMSQGTTIPAGTAVMTGTPAGVGAFRSPKTFLNDGDVVEVEMPGVGTLRNKIVFKVNLMTRIVIWVQRVVIRFFMR